MTDRYERIRAALAMGPTPGPWELMDGRTDTVENAQGYPVCAVNYHPYERYDHGTRAAYIAACDPDTIRELLEERDQLSAALEAAREDAERWRALREMDGGEIYALLGDCDGIHPEQADASIDEAIEKENSND